MRVAVSSALVNVSGHEHGSWSGFGWENVWRHSPYAWLASRYVFEGHFVRERVAGTSPAVTIRAPITSVGVGVGAVDSVGHGDFVYMGGGGVVGNVIIWWLGVDFMIQALTLGNGHVINFNKETNNRIIKKAVTG
ncbi:hypothetical protein KDA_28850 [Dictyobacter alpinus]|uniref:Uncharacterized protein n=1 Tax=Dictyobacter alpinus TaxID=2014873 RepID=A0A402B7R4_9CHLR|nr:hypothetical protein KDA_28850 [Dictyobacter alpinus]